MCLIAVMLRELWLSKLLQLQLKRRLIWLHVMQHPKQQLQQQLLLLLPVPLHPAMPWSSSGWCGPAARTSRSATPPMT